MQRKFSLAVVGMLGFALTLTACGDDDNGGGGNGGGDDVGGGNGGGDGGGDSPLPQVSVPPLPSTQVDPIDDVLTLAQAIVQCTLDGISQLNLKQWNQCIKDYTT